MSSFSILFWIWRVSFSSYLPNIWVFVYTFYFNVYVNCSNSLAFVTMFFLIFLIFLLIFPQKRHVPFQLLLITLFSITLSNSALLFTNIFISLIFHSPATLSHCVIIVAAGYIQLFTSLMSD
jgi:hypothetical protein